MLWTGGALTIGAAFAEPLKAAAAEILGHQLAYFANRLAELVAGDHIGFERQHDQRQRAVFR